MVLFIRANTKKIVVEITWPDRQFHVKDTADVAHRDVKIYCNTNQLPSLSFCGPNYNPHGARGLRNNYHLRFDPKLSNGVCAN